jgi:thioredoxin reductase
VRTETLTRCKPKNRELITSANAENKLKIIYNTNLVSINANDCLIQTGDKTSQVPNDLVYIFAGGELPTKFLQKAGVEIKKRFGYIMKKH